MCLFWLVFDPTFCASGWFRRNVHHLKVGKQKETLQKRINVLPSHPNKWHKLSFVSLNERGRWTLIYLGPMRFHLSCPSGAPARRVPDPAGPSPAKTRSVNYRQRSGCLPWHLLNGDGRRPACPRPRRRDAAPLQTWPSLTAAGQPAQSVDWCVFLSGQPH